MGRQDAVAVCWHVLEVLGSKGPPKFAPSASCRTPPRGTRAIDVRWDNVTRRARLPASRFDVAAALPSDPGRRGARGCADALC